MHEFLTILKQLFLYQLIQRNTDLSKLRDKAKLNDISPQPSIIYQVLKIINYKRNGNEIIL